jgi:peptide/nickel transport system ATP-binding protein
MTAVSGRSSRDAPAGVAEPVVRLRDVFCVHRSAEGDAAALQGASLDVEPGEVVCVLGPSGAGKSTLLRVIAGLEVPSAGVTQVLGWDVGRIAPRLRARLRHASLGFLDQRAEATISPELSGREAVALPLALRGAARKERLARADELLVRAGLGDRAQRATRELSGGERQRVALCAALAHRPALLLADEPTGELDRGSAEAIRRLIAELASNEGTTVIVVSHDPATASIADRSVRLRDGRVVEDRRPGERGLVVGRGGWLHLPPELLSSAGIADRVQVHLGEQGLVLTAAPERSDRGPEPASEARPDRPTRGWEPVAVELRRVSRARGRGSARRQVLDSVTHRFERGRLTALVGPSGSGKTTLLRLLCGLDAPDQGEILLGDDAIAGWDVERRAELRRGRIGYLPQEPTPINFLSATENVVLALRLRGWETDAALERAAVVLAWLGLTDRARQRVSRLSAGETQRVALARGLASARGLLVVDEPTSRLDEAGAANVGQLLAGAAVEDAQTVVCATHDPQLIRTAHEVVNLETLVK